MTKQIELKLEKTENYIPKSDKEKKLIKAFLKLKTEKDTASFIRDLLTLAEIEEFSNRLEIASLLMKGESYQKIAKQTGVSTTTVTRVAHWLFKGTGGYWKVLKK
jgi:TrpR-related protein YerC/YecD